MVKLSDIRNNLREKQELIKDLFTNEGYQKRAVYVVYDEKTYIRGKKKKKWAQKEFFGLAISGGGIRSASFGLGVLQALVGKDKLKYIDYLSTVSGGGYIGSSLTWFLKKGFPHDNGKTGKKAENFPFGQKGKGARFGDKENAVLDFIRQRSNYLIPGSGLTPISLFAIGFRTLFISLFVYLCLLASAVSWLIRFNIFDKTDQIHITRQLPLLRNGPIHFNLPVPLNYLHAAALLLLICVMLAGLWFSVRTFIKNPEKPGRYERLIRGQKMLGRVWSGIIILGLVGSISYTVEALGQLWQKIAVGGISTLTGVMTGTLKFIREQTKPQENRILTKIGTYIASLALIYGLLLLAYVCGEPFAGKTGPLIVISGIALLFALCVNLNYAGPHRNYRNRLMETFLPDKDSVVKNRWGAATDADTTPLSDMCRKPNRRPYHLINTNIVLVDSQKSRYRYRGGDSFVLSPLYCGSQATGWKKTAEYRKWPEGGITLATAMAISGAAANPHTGVSGKGITRNPLVSSLMTILNLRLGYWMQNPRLSEAKSLLPNYISPGIKEGLLGWGLDEENSHIQLTDGGHFDNLGIYELVRRKLDVIIVSDAGADPDFLFGDLANAVERVRVDFGAVIRFRDEDADLEGVIKGSAGDGVCAEKYSLAKRGYAVADITYQRGKRGVLVLIKTTMTPGLPADICGYKAKYDKFPDESTADQFFDESQFEAYRELGYQLTTRMLEDNESLKYSAKENPWIRWPEYEPEGEEEEREEQGA